VTTERRDVVTENEFEERAPAAAVLEKRPNCPSGKCSGIGTHPPMVQRRSELALEERDMEDESFAKRDEEPSKRNVLVKRPGGSCNKMACLVGKLDERWNVLVKRPSGGCNSFQCKGTLEQRDVEEPVKRDVLLEERNVLVKRPGKSCNLLSCKGQLDQ
jgi:hypothetical protein